MPFLKVDYFTDRSHKVIFLEIHEYVSQYDALPSLNAIGIECQERVDLTEDQFKEIIQVLNVLSDDPADHDCFVDTTEKWCQERAIYLSLMELSRLLTDRIPRGIKALFLKSFRKLLGLRSIKM